MIKPNSGREEQMRPFEEVYIAHRGFFDNKSETPENSISAFQKAVEYGYGIELDVQLTKDQKMVVFHDALLTRMCGSNLKLTDCTYDELQKYSLAESDEKIPLLKDVLTIVDGKVPLIIEIKPDGDFIGTARALAKMLESYQGIYCIESFHPGAVYWYRKHQPDVIRGQLSTNFKKNGIEVTWFQHFILSNLLCNFYSKPDFIAYNHKFSDQLSYQICRKLYHFEKVAWTIRSQKELEQARKIAQVFIFDSFIPQHHNLSKYEKGL
jgi:glycerophosphoryl diester phosphodiesterase